MAKIPYLCTLIRKIGFLESLSTPIRHPTIMDKGANFVDYVRVNCRSGRGGAGSAHFRREKFVPKGGPDGGDGGRGGHIILKGNRNLWTLLHLRYRKHLIAGNGENGAGALKTGADGDDVTIEVPLGTIARNDETGEIEHEIIEDGQTVILTRGGRGGLGNDHFKSATNQTPRYAQPGEEGIDEWKVLELRVLADVGLVGFPNAGKSTFLASVTAAKPEIAPYPFTTIIPNLGMVQYRDSRSFCIADIPGIIEGAHLGKGLGDRFLRHIERNATLLFMVAADSDDIREQYQILLNECEQYNPDLLHKQRILAITKADLIDEELEQMLQEELPTDVPVIFISAVTNKNIQRLKDMLWQSVANLRYQL
ncbi:MAG TPA: GTPase ObgE [Chitinophagales bacterium]|nr:GTPase ObgE [Chitinophagales bacterium]